MVQQRPLVLDRAIGDQWLVSSGVSGGDRVIVEGMMNIRPGNPVRAVPAKGVKTGAEALNTKQPSTESN